MSTEGASLKSRLVPLVERHEQLLVALADGARPHAEQLVLNKERARLEPIVSAWRTLEERVNERSDNAALLDDGDAELRSLARSEIARLDAEIAAIEDTLRALLAPRDPDLDKDVILEIRAGTGGDEAALFAGDLFRMYTAYAAKMGWRADMLSSSPGARGGFKEVVVELSGEGVLSGIRQEAGTHRVQRVPETEAQGRIHTSAVTVAVLPKASEIEVKIDDKDLRIDVMRAGGPGGQSVNTTDSAVRITHLPTGLVVVCQDEKSQLKNKSRALSILRTRLLDKARAERDAERADSRRSMVGSGDRSEKIRTYNFPQDRCTDHRAGITVHHLAKLLAGEIGPFLDDVRAALAAEALAE